MPWLQVVLLDFLLGGSGYEPRLDEISHILDVRDAGTEAEASELVERLEGRDGVAFQHPLEDTLLLRKAGCVVFVDVHRA